MTAEVGHGQDTGGPGDAALAFSAAHPEIGITVNSRMGRGEATCPDGPAGTREIRSIELKDLLDALEERYGYPRE